MTCFSGIPDAKHHFASFVDLLSYRAVSQPKQTIYTFLEDGETASGRLSNQELERQVKGTAAYLESMGATGKRALLLYPPGLDFVVAFFGCLAAGVVAVPVYPPRRNRNMMRLHAIVTSAQATLALTSSDVMASIESRWVQNSDLSTIPLLATDRIDAGLSEAWRPLNLCGDDVAFLQYTSGSTGQPKGVMVSHGNLLHNSSLIQEYFAHTGNSQGVIWLPPHHDMGLIGGVLQPLYAGFPVTLMPSVAFLQKPYRWLKAISDSQATTSGGPNFAYDLCIRRIKPAQKEQLDLSSWQVAFTGAEPIRADTLERFAAAFEPCGFRREAFYPCYGMAETTLIVTGGSATAAPVFQAFDKFALEDNQALPTQHRENARTLVGCGQSASDQKVAIVDPESRTLCACNQVGEIWVSGPSVAQGYWNQTEETQKIFHAYLADTGEGPFMRTEDLGFLYNDELFITGRLKDLLIIRGQNHYPQDIELTVGTAHPALQPDCSAAFSVEGKNEERLVIVQEVKRSYLRRLDVNALFGDIREAVTAQHGIQPYAITLIKPTSILKTSSGKVQRRACRTSFLNGSLSVVADWSENPSHRVKFIDLQTKVDSLLQKLSVEK